ncbi:MAG: menaquinone biosynthesis protein [Chloroflexi bacterium]|nr:menaquinone biosynthesis protein [Chloroflexota bacterium]
MRIRVARMPYLNSDVFYWSLPEDSCELRPLVPRAMAWAMEQGEIDAGPLPVVEWFRMEDRLAPIGNFCVATESAAVSILFFARRRAEELSGARIAVTEHTSTSVQLLRVLLAEGWQVEPAGYVLPEEPADALLLIGDPALRSRHGIEGYPYVYDLGAEWHRHTEGLPFVFAHWVARRAADVQAVSRFETALERSITDGLQNVKEIARRNGAGLPAGEAEAYVRGFTYRMGTRQYEAMAAFREKLGRLSSWRPASHGARARY